MLFENKVSTVFANKVRTICQWLSINPNWLMYIMWNESAHTFSPSIRNPIKGQTATGLIQFIESTAKGLGTTTAELAAMTAEDQLDYVYKYLKPYAGKMNSVTDVYLAIFYPASISWPASKAYPYSVYKVNKSFDYNGDGTLTKQDFIDKVNSAYNALTDAAPKSVTQDVSSPDFYQDTPVDDTSYYTPEAIIEPIAADGFNNDDWIVLVSGGVVVVLLVTLLLIYLKRSKK